MNCRCEDVVPVTPVEMICCLDVGPSSMGSNFHVSAETATRLGADVVDPDSFRFFRYNPARLLDRCRARLIMIAAVLGSKRSLDVRRRRWRRRPVKVDSTGSSFSRAFAADGHVVLGKPPDVFVRGVDADRRQRIATPRNASKHLDGVSAPRALVQAEHARRLLAASRLDVRREHAARHPLPESLQVALVGRLSGARLSAVQSAS